MRTHQLKHGYGMTLSACLWLGLFPLLQGGSYRHFTHDKWVCMLVLTGVTFLCFLFDQFFGPRRNKVSRRTFLPLVISGVLLLWMFITCLAGGASPADWWHGESVRQEGFFTQLCYFSLFACFFFSRVSLKPVLLSAAAGLAFFTVIALLQRSGINALGLYPPGYSYELNPEFQGTIGNIDMGTGYLLLLTALFLYSLPLIVKRGRNGGSPSEPASSRRRPAPGAVAMVLVCLAALLVCLFLIITMGVQFGMISLGVLFLVTVFRFLPKRLRLPLLILLIVAVLLIVWFWPGQKGGIWELHEIFHGRARLSFGSDRVAVWLYSLRLAGQSLLLGGGSGTFPARFNRFLSENSLVIPEEQDGVPFPNNFDNPHNIYISYLTDHGIPGLVLFLALLLISVFRRRDGFLPLLSPCSAAMLCYAVQAIFSFSVCIITPMFWILLALSYTEHDRELSCGF